MSIKNSSTHTKKYRLVLSAVHMVYRLVNSTFNAKELLLRLTRLVCQILHASSAWVYLLDPESKKIIFIAVFNGKINILKEKKEELSEIPVQEKAVTEGSTFIQKHLVGLPLVADDNVGAIFIARKKGEPAFDAFDREILSVIAEQSVIAIKNLQLYDQQQEIILGSIKTIGRMLEQQGNVVSSHAPVYFKIVQCLAEKLGMTQSEIDCLRYASVLHDAGSLDVPYEKLLKSSRLTAEEFKAIRSHPARTVELIKPVEFLKPILPIILYHHEKYDGTGYPSGLKKEQIPLGARVMAIMDAFEAMTRGRPYRKRLSTDAALSELKSNSGTQFDPRIVNIFCGLSKQKKIRKYLSLMKR
ncbi:MAG TPA: HD domain-containing phosphohydrolase [Candidatus Omnitrophota bacterium]|nr:HD domain-containing phosphohydrolase [Candidatus Omnitrophota bacterium]HPD83903.1 HD domain-containing phosphohydrolase [Candidatus Omnitrophota bacterium]HRZ02760.1 HD domain-containing phosphohydrolase [Candidatus Omnitrophota bacterium]